MPQIEKEAIWQKRPIIGRAPKTPDFLTICEGIKRRQARVRAAQRRLNAISGSVEDIRYALQEILTGGYAERELPQSGRVIMAQVESLASSMARAVQRQLEEQP